MSDENLPSMMSFSIEGNPHGPTMVFVHGWPDDAGLWEAQVQEFKSDYHCVRVTLPGFGDAPVKRCGADFNQLVEMLFQIIDEEHGEDKDKKVILVGHDWGCTICYLFEARYPQLVRALITMDVGAHVEPSSMKHALFLIGYQWTLIFAWLVGGIIPALGNLMAQGMARLLRVPKSSRVRARMNYLYFYFWRGILIPSKRASPPANLRSQVPTLYFFGARKPFMFHSEKWLKIVKSRPKSKVIGLPKAGHWLSLDEPERVNQEIKSWLPTIA